MNVDALRPFPYHTTGTIMSTDDSMFATVASSTIIGVYSDVRRIMAQTDFPPYLRTESLYTMAPFTPTDELRKNLIAAGYTDGQFFLEWTNRVWIDGQRTKTILRDDMFHTAVTGYLEALQKVTEVPEFVPFEIPIAEHDTFGFSGKCQLRIGDLALLDETGMLIPCKTKLSGMYITMFVLRALINQNTLQLPMLIERNNK